ncbi:MAG: glycosyltransferase [Cyanobacteria bacterium J06638_22]
MDIISASDRAHLRKFRRNYSGGYYVIGRLGDPLFQVARARTIWAAHTASAADQLGLTSTLVVGRSELPFRLETQGSETNADRILGDFYGIEGEVDLLVLNEIDRMQQEVPAAQDAAIRQLAQCARGQGFWHVRDPALARWCSRNGPAFLYEDHGEDYHDDARPGISEVLNSPACRVVVAITAEIAARLEASGVHEEKIMVRPSASSLRRGVFTDRKISMCRDYHLRDGHQRLIVYAGGLQQERGISHILQAAQRLPSYRFIIVGGHSVDRESWQSEHPYGVLPNVCWTGYLPLPDTFLLELSADLLLVTREKSERAKISSPLKLFEYLRTGTPIVSYTIEIAEEYGQQDLALVRYNSAEPDTLSSAIKTALDNYPVVRGGYDQNILAGERCSWEWRLMQIIREINSRDALA